MKKLILVLMAVLLVAIGVMIVGCKSEEEKSKEELFPKIEEMGAMPAIEYVEPPEAKGKLQVQAKIDKEHWERLGALSVEVKVKNVSKQILLKAIVTHSLEFKSGQTTHWDYGVGSTVAHLPPGEIGTADLSMLVLSNAQTVRRVRISLKDILFEGETVSPPTKPSETPAGEVKEILPSKVAVEYVEHSRLPDWQVTYDTPQLSEDLRWIVSAYVEYTTLWTGKWHSYKFCVEFNQGEGRLIRVKMVSESQTGRLIKMSGEILAGPPQEWRIIYPVEATYAKFWIEVD